jgi:outer membrane protein
VSTGRPVAEEESMRRHTFIGLSIVGLLWWAMLSMALAAEALKVAVMDQQLVIERSKAGKRALEDLKAYQATRQKIISSDDQELKELEQALQEGKLSEAGKQEKQTQFQAKVEAYQRRLADFNREIQQKQREMVAEYTKKVQDAAQAVAQREGYVAIIDRGNETMIRIVIYHRQGLDVTDQVVKEFDKQNK